jgi:hypothetical protein
MGQHSRIAQQKAQLKKSILSTWTKQISTDNHWEVPNSDLFGNNIQVELYSAFETNPNTKSAKEEIKLVLENLPEILSGFSGNYAMCELGPGSGIKTALTLDNAIMIGQSPEMVLLLDINRGYLNQATEKIKNRIPVVRTINADFLTIDINKLYAGKKLILCLGNTCGNSDKYLDYIFENLKQGDRAVFSIQTSDINLEETLRNYQHESAKNFVWGPMNALGFTKEMVSYEFAFNKQKNRVEYNFELLEVPIDLKQAGIQVGHTITSAISMKPSIADINQKLSEVAHKIYQLEGSSQLLITVDRKN